MTLGGVQFSGLASGLDTGALIDAILAVEGRALRATEDRKEEQQQKLTLLGTFEGLVNKLRQKATDLQSASKFFAHKLSVGEEGVATFTLGGNAEAGAHTLEVNSLASADRYAFGGVADPETTALGTGTIGFTYGGSAYSVNVVAGSDNLNDVAAAINTAAGGDVTASVVNVGTSTTPSYQLIIAGDDTGADFTITGLTSSVAGLGGATRVSTASNAEAVVDGLVVQRASNLFSDVLPGVSFSVSRRTAPGTPMSFTVDLDPEGIRKNIEEFVAAYNEVIEFVNDQNSYSTTTGPGGKLFGDDALGSVRTTLARALFAVDRAVVTADTKGYSTLGLIGIDVQSDGQLKIDETQLDEKLSGDLEAFSDFFRRVDGDGIAPDQRGLFVRVEQLLDGLLDGSSFVGTDGKTRKLEGLFAGRRTAVGNQIKDFDREIERQNFRLDKLHDALITKFAALERLLSGLQSQQSFLSNVANLPGSR